MNLSDISASPFYLVSNLVLLAICILIAFKFVAPYRNSFTRAGLWSLGIIVIAMSDGRVGAILGGWNTFIPHVWPSLVLGIAAIFTAAGISKLKQ